MDLSGRPAGAAAGAGLLTNVPRRSGDTVGG
jgi:hypothetical protein